MNLAVVTTVGINAGDNFIYEGFKSLFPAKLHGSTFLINKADVPKKSNYRELIDESDLIVICGTPIFYENCYKMRWQNEILKYSKKSGKKILILAVGSNFRCSVDGTVEPPDFDKDRNYADFVARYGRVMLGDFIVREKYCSQFLKDMEFHNVRQVACPSLFASDGYAMSMPGEQERDLVFMIWGDTHWNCALPAKKVRKICAEVQKILQTKFSNKKVVWVCHDFQSYKGLMKYVPRQDILFSTNYMDFLKYYSRCDFGFSIKVHGAMLLSSLGVPSLLLQLDSRAAVIEALDEHYATLSSSLELLTEMCDEKLRNREEFRDKIIALKSRYREDYRELFGGLGFA